MGYPFGETVFRDRRARIADPYRPTVTTEDDWDPDLTIELPGAFIASSSSSARADATRSEILTDKSLYLTDPDADVIPRDRIRQGGTLEDLDSGTAYMVKVRPQADTNPFTGWRPVAEIPLERVEG